MVALQCYNFQGQQRECSYSDRHTQTQTATQGLVCQVNNIQSRLFALLLLIGFCCSIVGAGALTLLSEQTPTQAPKYVYTGSHRHRCTHIGLQGGNFGCFVSVVVFEWLVNIWTTHEQKHGRARMRRSKAIKISWALFRLVGTYRKEIAQHCIITYPIFVTNITTAG